MVQTPTPTYSELALHVLPKIEAALVACTQFPGDCPRGLAEAIRYSLLAPAKRLRPQLVLMAAEACGGQIADAMPAACAVEMIHTYSLIHDDLPAMDDDDLRRGRPTNHKVFGEGLAILAGDALLTLAFEVLARDVRPAAVAAACCAALGEAAGATALVGGQADDLAGGGQVEGVSGAQRNLEILESIHRRKTGAMFLVSLRLGGLTARAADWQMRALEEYGWRMGLAFQIVDDLLDVGGDEAALGKRVGKDADRGKLTFPGLLGVAESRARAERLIGEACQALEPLGTPAEGLAALARFVLERDR
jgi:geranylgeranyl diphosphate synthase, type II